MEQARQLLILILAFGSIVAFAQHIDLGDYQLDPATKHWVPVLDQVRGKVRCGNSESAKAKVELIETESGDGIHTLKVGTFTTESDAHGVFSFTWVPAGLWRLMVRASCDGGVHRVGQLIRVSPRWSSGELEMILNMRDGKVVLRKHEREYPVF